MSLPTRRIGDRAVSAIGMGAAGLSVGDPPPEEDGVAALVAAFECGVTLVDTAACYVPGHDAQGHNEALIARALAEWGGPAESVLVATKAGIVRTGSGGTIATDFSAAARPEEVVAQCEVSLRALGRDCIELYQLHSPADDVPLAETMGAFAGLVAAGKVRQVGVCNVDVDQLAEARSVVDVASVQNSFSPGNLASLPVIEACEADGIAFLAYSPLGGLGARARNLPERAPGFAEVAAELSVSPQRLALAWELARSPVVIPIPGARRAATIADSAAATGLELSAEHLARLDTAAGCTAGA